MSIFFLRNFEFKELGVNFFSITHQKIFCDRHKVSFLAKCINCHPSFMIPSQWEIDECQDYGFPFERMARHQKPLKK